MQIGETQGFGEMRTAASAAATQAAETTEAAKAAEAKKENEKKSIAFQSGDTVEISKQGMTLAASTAAPAKAAAPEASAPKEDTLLKSVKDRIKQLQEEIQELQGSNMDEKEKQQKVAMLNQELATQNATLQELQGKDSSGSASRYGQGGLVF